MQHQHQATGNTLQYSVQPTYTHQAYPMIGVGPGMGVRAGEGGAAPLAWAHGAAAGWTRPGGDADHDSEQEDIDYMFAELTAEDGGGDI